MNKVILIGNLATDPEAFTTQSGISRSTFRLAVQRKYANAEGRRDADFLTIVAWRGTADFCNSYLVKGRKIAVEGSVQVRSYDGDDKKKQWVTEIITDSVEALGRAKNGDPGPEEPAPYPSADPNEFTEVEDDELSFD